MTNFQKAFCVFLSLCFFAVLALLPGQIIRRGNVFGQLPLYCFLEDKARSIPQSEDPETLEKIIADNGAYLGQKIREENQSAKKADNLSAQAEKESAPAKERQNRKKQSQIRKTGRSLRQSPRLHLQSLLRKKHGKQKRQRR